MTENNDFVLEFTRPTYYELWKMSRFVNYFKFSLVPIYCKCMENEQVQKKKLNIKPFNIKNEL